MLIRAFIGSQAWSEQKVSPTGPVQIYSLVCSCLKTCTHGPQPTFSRSTFHSGNGAGRVIPFCDPTSGQCVQELGPQVATQAISTRLMRSVLATYAKGWCSTESAVGQAGKNSDSPGESPVSLSLLSASAILDSRLHGKGSYDMF